MRLYTIKEHLAELQVRLLKIVISFTLVFTFCYYFSKDIYILLLRPLFELTPEINRKIIYTGLTEAFFTYIKLAAFCSFVLILPIIALQIYNFIKPGLYKEEKIFAAFVLCMSPALFWFSSIFVFNYVMPKAWSFFLSFEDHISAMPIILEAKISEYFNLVMHLVIAFGLAFQLPVVLLILDLLQIINVAALRKKRRIAIVINFIISGVLTPPDVISQFALAIPMILLYEIAIMMCIFVENKIIKNKGYSC